MQTRITKQLWATKPFDWYVHKKLKKMMNPAHLLFEFLKWNFLSNYTCSYIFFFFFKKMTHIHTQEVPAQNCWQLRNSTDAERLRRTELGRSSVVWDNVFLFPRFLLYQFVSEQSYFNWSQWVVWLNTPQGSLSFMCRQRNVADFVL